MPDIYSKREKGKLVLSLELAGQERGAEACIWDLSEQPEAAFEGCVKSFSWTRWGPRTQESWCVVMVGSVH